MAESIAGKLGVAYHADDPKHSGVLRHVKAEMLVQWLFTVLEKAFYKRLIYHRHQFRSLIIGRGKAASTQHRDAKFLR